MYWRNANVLHAAGGKADRDSRNHTSPLACRRKDSPIDRNTDGWPDPLALQRSRCGEVSEVQGHAETRPEAEEGATQMKKAIILLAAVLAAGPAALTSQKQVEPIRVFVFTAAVNGAGFVDTDVKQRNDSVKDLKKSLTKNPIIQVVSERDGADVTLEVLGRDFEAAKYETGPSGVVLRVNLTASTYSTVFEGRTLYYWREAANDAAKSIEHWIRANHDSLISKRTAKAGSVK